MAERVHAFDAIAFVENLSLRPLATALGGSVQLTPRNLILKPDPAGEGEVYLYPFGAVVFHALSPPERDRQLKRIYAARPGLTVTVTREDFRVREEPGAATEIVNGALVVDRLTPGRASIVALTLAQSAAMEYYERVVDALFARTEGLVSRLEKRGSVSMRTRHLHRFIGEAISNRNEVLSVLYLLDKPEAAWDDPAMDRIYDDLRDEFDLADRWEALSSKLTGVQETLELILDLARERRMTFLEISMLALFLLEIFLALIPFLPRH